MKSLAKYSFILMSLSSTVMAAGNGAHHEPSVKDLMYPAINFTLLVGFAIWKLKGPLKSMFDKQADNIVSMMNSAEERNKDATAKLNALETKLSTLDQEVAKIASDYKLDVTNFAVNQEKERIAIVERTIRDNKNKIEGEQKSLIEELNSDLLDSVIAKTKQTINANASLKATATKNIVSELR